MYATIAQAASTVPEKIATPTVAWKALAPVLILIGGAVVILGISAVMRRKPRSSVFAFLTVVTALAAIAAAVPLWRDVTDPAHGPYTAVKGAIAVDGFAVFFTVLVCVAVALAALLADGYLRREGLDVAELHWKEGLVMAPLLALIVFLGVYPKPVLERIQPSVDALIAHVEDQSCAAENGTCYHQPENATPKAQR